MSYQYPSPPDDAHVAKAKPPLPRRHRALPQQSSPPVVKNNITQSKTSGREKPGSYVSPLLQKQSVLTSTEPVPEHPSAPLGQGGRKKHRLGYQRTPIACRPLVYQEYNVGSTPMPEWISTNAVLATSSPQNASTSWQGYPMESPTTPQYPVFSPTPAESSWTTGLRDPGSRGEMAWSGFPPSGRPMSYGSDSLGNPNPA
ncbi:hypothetical protein S40288_07052, partial [Stachybotrys chartarum IBT 40288]